MKESKIPVWETFILFMYALVMFCTVRYHEPWRDEAQAWLIARDLPFEAMFKQMAYEGSPALWHLILSPFAKLGFSYAYINVIHLFIIILAAAIFLYKSPFSRITKALFVFSYYMAWEYSIIARSYSLSILLIFSIAAVYSLRFKKPIIYALLIGLLSNTNVHSVFIAIPLIALFLFEGFKSKISKPKVLLAEAIMYCGLLLSFSQLLSPADNINYKLFLEAKWSFASFAIRYAFFPCFHFFSNITFLAGIIMLFIFCFYIYKISLKLFLVTLFSYAGLFYLYIFKGICSYRHFGFIVIVILFVLWIGSFYDKKHILSTKDKKGKDGNFFKYSFIMLLLNISFAMAVFPATIRHYQEYRLLFSGSKAMAGYIKESNLLNKTIVAHESAYASALLPYLPDVRFWYADVEKEGTFVTWNKIYGDNMSLSFDEIIRRINANDLSMDKVLILLNYEMPADKLSEFELLHKVDTEMFAKANERYYLYKPILSTKQME